ncbi:glycosyltransferase family 2 protein [Chryseobacterium oncorhynchi]|uniref:Rhamnosyl transferase n=1 Tax=Chryseobacterium oncorhynchi TaxID=741074 RepID=A0A316WN16_9FLAO|nr:glycosyltransferase family 2 protein [Chryseobacterium oncorhynchi]PWN60618.1 rhamnosyl transferase [Chryseobacterium oncorhynchi]
MIDILMATYNGGSYIENQILSLIGQTYKDWRLLVHDDGSSDETVKIIKRYEKLDSRINLIEDNIKCGGAAQNFLHLLKHSNADYIVFCDQDDIWMESKLEVLFNKIKNVNEPFAVYCNAYAYNGVKIIADKVSLIERDNLENSLFLNSGVQGCSLMFNKQLLDLLRDYPDYIYMHDHYITIGAVAFGKLCYIDESLMLYRQHDNNVTGNVPISIMDRIKTFTNRKNAIIDFKHYDANKSFFEKYGLKLSNKDVNLFKAYLLFPNLNLLQKLSTIIKYNFKIGNSSLILLIKALFKNALNKNF